MILRLAYIVIFFLALAIDSRGQCYDFKLKKSDVPNYITVFKTKNLSGDKGSDKDDYDYSEQKKQLTEQLKIELAEKISTRVSTETSHQVNETNRNFSERFISETKVSSDLQFGVLEPKFCFDYKARELHGLISVPIEEVSLSIFNYCLAEMKKIKFELKAKLNSAVKDVDLKKVQRDIDFLSNNYAAAIQMDLKVLDKIDEHEWNALVEEVITLKTQMESDKSQSERKTSLAKAMNLAETIPQDNENFKKAIQILNTLSVVHSDSEVREAKELVKSSYLNFVTAKIESYNSQKRFEESLSMMSDFCANVPCEKDFINKRNDIEKKYFDYAFDLFQTHLKYKDKPNIEKFKSILDQLSSIDIKRYSQVHEDYIDFKVGEGKEQIMNHWDARRFNEAYSTLIKLENTYGVQKADLGRYKSKLKHRLYRIEAHGVKSSRAKVYSFWMGSDVFANEVVFDSINTFAVNQYYFAYSGGMYRKIRIAEESGKRGYPVRSDFIGVKFRMRDYRSTTSYFISDSLAALNKPVQSLDYDIALDGIASRVIHYSVGLNVNDKFDWEKPNFYFLTVGLRIPISNLSFVTDITGQTLFDSHSSLLVSAGLHLRLDYRRKFNLSDKRSVRSRLY
jgi:hypothetical protein